MERLLFGTAGIPANSKGSNTIDGIKAVNKLGLDAMELEFVRNINITADKTIDVKEAANNSNVVLTCHAPYYVNLNAKEKDKLHASKERVIKSAIIASKCGAYSVCFHPGVYFKDEKTSVYDKIKEALHDIVKKVREEGYKIWIRPETTGRESQFGNVDELIKLSQEIHGVLPCVDFSHLHARHNGKYNSYEEWKEVLTKIEKELGREALDNMHIHLSGIEYGNKGEIRHLDLKESDLNYKELVKAWKDFKIKGVVISESPNIEGDALLLKKIYEH